MSEEGADLLSFLLVSSHRQFKPAITNMTSKCSECCPKFVSWLKSHLSNNIVSHSRAGPTPSDSFFCSILPGNVRNTWLFFITLSAKLIEMRLLISSLGLHLQLNGWWCLSYGLINKLGKHELRIYDESDTVLSTDSTEMNGRSRLSKSSQSSKRWACANRYL